MSLHVVSDHVQQEDLRTQILRENLRQQRVLTWVLGAVGVGGIMFIIALVVMMWRVALTIQ